MSREVQTQVEKEFLRNSFLEHVIENLSNCRAALVDLGRNTSAQIIEDVIMNLVNNEETESGSTDSDGSGSEREVSSNQLVRFRCVREGSRLRVKIISGEYNRDANCWFPKENGFRAEGREWIVPAQFVSFARGSRVTPYYIVDKDHITFDSSGSADGTGSSDGSRNVKVFGDD